VSPKFRFNQLNEPPDFLFRVFCTPPNFSRLYFPRRFLFQKYFSRGSPTNSWGSQVRPSFRTGNFDLNHPRAASCGCGARPRRRGTRWSPPVRSHCRAAFPRPRLNLLLRGVAVTRFSERPICAQRAGGEGLGEKEMVYRWGRVVNWPLLSEQTRPLTSFDSSPLPLDPRRNIYLTVGFDILHPLRVNALLLLLLPTVPK